DRRLWGDSSFGYHLTNVGLHVVAVLLLYAFLRRTLDDAGLARADLAAFPGAALFAVHPLQRPAVGYISGRSAPLPAAWLLAPRPVDHARGPAGDFCGRSDGLAGRRGPARGRGGRVPPAALRGAGRIRGPLVSGGARPVVQHRGIAGGDGRAPHVPRKRRRLH